MEMTFKDIVKLIHPDTNPDIQDPSGKMTLVMKYKRDSLVLWNLAIKWGLVQGEYNIASPEAPTKKVVPAVKTGWGYSRTNPEWTPSTPTRKAPNTWTTQGSTTKKSPPKTKSKKTTFTYIKCHDIVHVVHNSTVYEGIVMNIETGWSDYVVDILITSGIIQKSMLNLRSTEIFKKIKKATKKQIVESEMKYNLLRRK